MPEPYRLISGNWAINDGAFGYFHGETKEAVIARWEEAVDTYNQATGRTPKPGRLQLPLLPSDVFGSYRTPGESITLLQKWNYDMNKALEEWNE